MAAASVRGRGEAAGMSATIKREYFNNAASPLRLITTGLLGFICRQYGEPFQLGADKRRTQDIQTQILDIDSLHIYTLEKYCRRHQNI